MLRRELLTGVGALLLAAPAGAKTLTQMNLADLANRADKVFRGTVISVKAGSVKAGGGELPILVYRLRVEEPFKGDFGEGKEKGLVEIRMVGEAKVKAASGPQRFGLWRDVPRLQRGQEYVLFATRPSSIGLSTTVGLGQGAFRILGAGKDEKAVNAFDNLGLGRGMPEAPFPSAGGPVPYADLARAIRAVLGQ